MLSFFCSKYKTREGAKSIIMANKNLKEKIFTPDGNITRAMMITVLYRAEGEPEVIGEATFEDIDKNAYYAKAVVWGQQNGIIKGYSEAEYAPEQDILREQIAAIMHRYAKYKGYDVSVGENTNILSYEDFDKLQFRVGKIIACEEVKKSKKLLCSQVQIGSEVKQIVSGIKQHYTAEEMIGKKVMVLVNLKPAKLAGVLSEGMLLCAEDENGNLALVTPEKEMPAGAEIA